MYISYNWLRELIEGELPGPQELAGRLTMAGLAVDAVHAAGGDSVLEFDLTSNRPDCLSHVGIAREAAALFGGRVKPPETQASDASGPAEGFTHVTIEDAALCPRYAARVVRGVRIGPSPAWLVERLQAIGERAINNVADITNYVMHELGQPLHAFDLHTLAERRIVVRRARAGEKMTTLDDVERVFDPEMLVIADAARPVAIAGVMGGRETGISDATVDVLIEAAYFDPQSVRRTSKLLNLQTEASYRFERGTDYEGVRLAQDRCVALICELAGGTATEDSVDVYPKRLAQPVVSLRPRRVEELTSLRATADESTRLLTALGFRRQDGSAGAGRGSADAERLTFVVPTWRTDVHIEEDLVEEVARLVGYDKMTEALPPTGIAGEYLTGDQRRRRLRRALIAHGFNEAINFSFVEAANEGRYELIPDLQTVEGEGAFVHLTNPIVEGATLMRPTLVAGLLDSVRHNFNRGTRSARLFETGRVFAAGAGEDRPRELEAFALALTGEALEEGRTTAREFDFYDLKGALELAVEGLNVEGVAFEPASVGHLREGQAARVLLEGRPVGALGRLSEELSSAYKFRQPVYVAEVNLTALLERPERPVRYAPLPRFPGVARDVSFIAARAASYGEMRRAILSLGIPECRGVALVDVYEGANLPEGKRSLTLRVEYRADERTLRDEEVDAMHARAVGALESEFGAQLRG
jgi:phenylalanyl-tRNA synthetase beta chain